MKEADMSYCNKSKDRVKLFVQCADRLDSNRRLEVMAYKIP